MRDDQWSYLLAVCNQLVSPTLLLLAVVLSAPYRPNLECKPLLKGIFRALPREQTFISFALVFSRAVVFSCVGHHFPCVIGHAQALMKPARFWTNETVQDIFRNFKTQEQGCC